MTTTVRFQDLTPSEQASYNQRYVLPSNTDNVYLNHNNQPYELIASSRVVLTLRKEALIDGGFHR